MNDNCLERSRRTAWARYFQQRADAEQIALWAGELAEWIEALADDIPPAAAELVDICQRRLPPRDRQAIRRYVAAHAGSPLADVVRIGAAS